MTISQQIQVKTNLMASLLTNEVAKWIKKNSDKNFFEVTKYKQADLDKMITLTFDWRLSDIAKISALLGKQIIIWTQDEETNAKRSGN